MFTICSWAQITAAKLCTWFPPKDHDCHELALPLGGHPLALLYEAEDELVASITEMFKASCPSLSEEYEELFSQSQVDLASSSPLRCKVIEELTRQKYEELKDDHEPTILEALSQITRSKIQDVFDHIPQLLNVMNMHGLIENSHQITVNIWRNEEHLEEKSCKYDLARPELISGEIGYINGIMRSFDDAKGDATLLSDNLCDGHNIHGIYSTTHGVFSDLQITVYGQVGAIPQPVQLLLNEWCSFFNRESDPTKCYLQICMSQGVVMTKLALEHLPPFYRKRICVLAIAPAGFIPPIKGCQVRHFVKMNDIVPVALAHGRNRLKGDDPEIIKVPSDDGTNPHDPHGQHYIDAIKPYIDQYIESNSTV